MKIIIPAYQPDQRLLQLVHNIKENSDFEIIIVNDGSNAPCSSIFDKAGLMGCTILTHPTNQGKGAALKTAFHYLLRMHCEDSFICVDCDGQHSWQDIQRLAEAMKKHPTHIILGSRKLHGKIPLRSILGNKITKSVFTIITGDKIPDTQTGLRGFCANMLPWLIGLSGTRYEYEMNQLLEAKKAGYSIDSIPIETIYVNNNKGSHFHPLIDSIRVYLPILKFSISSMLCGSLDFILLFVLKWLTDNLLYSVLLARVVSSLCNYLLNKHLVVQS